MVMGLQRVRHEYKGQVVAVDTYCWLHKGAVACAEKLAKGEPTDK